MKKSVSLIFFVAIVTAIGFTWVGSGLKFRSEQKEYEQRIHNELKSNFENQYRLFGFMATNPILKESNIANLESFMNDVVNRFDSVRYVALLKADEALVASNTFKKDGSPFQYTFDHIRTLDRYSVVNKVLKREFKNDFVNNLVGGYYSKIFMNKSFNSYGQIFAFPVLNSRGDIYRIFVLFTSVDKLIATATNSINPTSDFLTIRTKEGDVLFSNVKESKNYFDLKLKDVELPVALTELFTVSFSQNAIKTSWVKIPIVLTLLCSVALFLTVFLPNGKRRSFIGGMLLQRNYVKLKTEAAATKRELDLSLRQVEDLVQDNEEMSKKLKIAEEIKDFSKTIHYIEQKGEAGLSSLMDALEVLKVKVEKMDISSETLTKQRNHIFDRFQQVRFLDSKCVEEFQNVKKLSKKLDIVKHNFTLFVSNNRDIVGLDKLEREFRDIVRMINLSFKEVDQLLSQKNSMFDSIKEKDITVFNEVINSNKTKVSSILESVGMSHEKLNAMSETYLKLTNMMWNQITEYQEGLSREVFVKKLEQIKEASKLVAINSLDEMVGDDDPTEETSSIELSN